jgi:G:T-mismatch repair DNA endonuclease (very short patch repair protein)
MTDVFSNSKRSEVMSPIRGKGNHSTSYARPELMLPGNRDLAPVALQGRFDVVIEIWSHYVMRLRLRLPSTMFY